jgi:D-alanyl-D-alanine carboxypeptidase
VGAFASINAMQGYRPNPVAQYAIQLMRAHREKKSLPAIPRLKAATDIENPASYTGVFKGEAGRQLELIAEGSKLLLLHKGERIALEGGDNDSFTVPHRDFSRFLLVFGRADSKDAKSAVVEAGWGDDWFVNDGYAGPKTFAYPKEWNKYLGHYRNENPWVGSARITTRKGQLLIDGVVPLEAGDGGVFYLRDEESNTEWVRFGEAVNGKVMRLKLSGEDLWRVMAD